MSTLNLNANKIFKQSPDHNMVPGGVRFDHMVYLRVFEGCNLFCEHCFIPANPKKMTFQNFESNKIGNLLAKEGNIKEGSLIHLQWHGGEPTMFGVKYLREAISEVEKDTRFTWTHGIQTNLMTFMDFPDEWAELYKQYFGGHVGVSWDVAIRHLKSPSLSSEESNEDFEKKFWPALSKLIEMDLKPYLVITVTKLFFERFQDPFTFFELMKKHGISHLNFERITETGFARKRWDSLGLSNREYSEKMSRFFKAYALYRVNNPDIKLFISPFDGLAGSVVEHFKQESGSKESPTLSIIHNHLNADNLNADNLNTDNLNADNLDNLGNIQNSRSELTNIVGLNNLVESKLLESLSYKNQGYGCWSGECDTRFHTIDASGYKHGCTALNSEEDNTNKELKETLPATQKIIWMSKPKSNASTLFTEARAARQEPCEGCEFLPICSSGCLSVPKIDFSGECSGGKILFETIKKVLINF